MSLHRVPTQPLGERVASLETSSVVQGAKLDEHERSLKVHTAWLNQVRGSIRTLAVLWAIAVGLLGLRFVQDAVSKPAAAAIHPIP